MIYRQAIVFFISTKRGCRHTPDWLAADFDVMQDDTASEKPNPPVSHNTEALIEDQLETTLAETKRHRHSGLQLLLICIGLCLAVFLVALVSLSPHESVALDLTQPGPYHYSHCDPEITDEFGALDAVG